MRYVAICDDTHWSHVRSEICVRNSLRDSRPGKLDTGSKVATALHRRRGRKLRMLPQ